MKVTTKRPSPPVLWDWLKARLPSDLVAYERTDGYSGTWGITIKQRGMAGLLNRWFGESVATVEGRTVEVQHPNWTSDLRDLLSRYEREHGVETELVICEHNEQGKEAGK